MDNEYFDEEEEIEEIYMESVERKTGSRKKTAAFMLGGAAIGAFAGDILYGRDYLAEPGFVTVATDDGYITSAVMAAGRDHGGLIEDLIGADIANDEFFFQYTFLQRVEDGEVVLSGPITYTNDVPEYALEYMPALSQGIEDGTVQEIITPDGAMIGGGTGAAGGFGVDYAQRKRKSEDDE